MSFLPLSFPFRVAIQLTPLYALSRWKLCSVLATAKAEPSFEVKLFGRGGRSASHPRSMPGQSVNCPSLTPEVCDVFFWLASGTGCYKIASLGFSVQLSQLMDIDHCAIPSVSPECTLPELSASAFSHREGDPLLLRRNLLEL